MCIINDSFTVSRLRKLLHYWASVFTGIWKWLRVRTLPISGCSFLQHSYRFLCGVGRQDVINLPSQVFCRHGGLEFWKMQSSRDSRAIQKESALISPASNFGTHSPEGGGYIHTERQMQAHIQTYK